MFLWYVTFVAILYYIGTAIIGICSDRGKSRGGMGKKSLKDKEERRIIRRGEKNLSKREELEKIDNIWEKGEELKKVWMALKKGKKLEEKKSRGPKRWTGGKTKKLKRD